MTDIIPHNLLPIRRPLEDTIQYNETYFYENVVKLIIPDIIQMETNGIPIDLSKVSILENVVIDVLSEVHKRLSNNELMLNFLKFITKRYEKEKIEQLKTKKKELEDFLVPFNITNKTHRSYVINTYLTSICKQDMCMDEWTIKDLRKLSSIVASNFLQSLLNKDENTYVSSEYIKNAMTKLAQDKANIYNKNKIDSKIQELSKKDIIKSFNPSSPIQKQKFFEFYSIKSEKETSTGNAQWDRSELERLQKLLKIMIDEKGRN